jgi:hypothetical protein
MGKVDLILEYFKTELELVNQEHLKRDSDRKWQNKLKQ